MARRAVAPAQRAERRFDGVVAAAIELDAFDRLYQAIDLGDGGFITLLSNKGTLITRVPDPGVRADASFPAARS